MSLRVPRSWIRIGWTPGRIAVALLTMAAGMAVTFDAWSDIFRIASKDAESSHIFLVPIVFAWLVYVRRGRLRHCQPRETWVGPAVVALGWLLHSFGDFGHFESLWHGGAILVVLGCFLSVTGAEVLRRFFPALVLLAFLVPVPGVVRQAIAIPLQTVSAEVTHHVLIVFGIETDLFGNVVQINGVDVAIAEACNGMRMVFALFLVCYAFAFGTPLRHSVRFLILALSPVAAIFCNVIRLAPTVWCYGRFSQETALMFHDVSGWVMLPVAFLLLLGIVRLLRWAMVPVYRYTLAFGNEG